MRFTTVDGNGNVVEDYSTPDGPTPGFVVRSTLAGKARAALAANATFLALASPTNAQVVAQVQRLTRENNALIRLVVAALEDASVLVDVGDT